MITIIIGLYLKWKVYQVCSEIMKEIRDEILDESEMKEVFEEDPENLDGGAT